MVNLSNNIRLLSVAVCLALVFPVQAADKCLYSNIDGFCGNALLDSLHKDIKNHTVLSYANVWAYKSNIDVLNGLYIVDMYSDCGNTAVSNHCKNITSTFCDCYNREHALPKSFWGHDDSSPEPMYTDAVHVIPVDGATNEKRSAYAYGEVKNATWSNTVGSKLGSNGSYTVFEPRDEYKGDLARIYFYMITCYQDKNFTKGGQGYRCFTYTQGKARFQGAFLNLLLKWHRNDPVSDWERTRNNRIQKKQGNRNPFVDDPELVEHIWGNKKTTPYICGDHPTYLIEQQQEENSSFKIQNSKFLKDGHLYIIINGQTYNIQGQLVN